MKYKLSFIVFFLGVFCLTGQDQTYTTASDIGYYFKTEIENLYQQDRCKLDIYYPKNSKGLSTVIWFHGGGLTSGEKHIPEGLSEENVIVVSPNYRLYPKIKHPVFIEDAARAVAWVFENIEEYGGDKDQIFISGHSAGGYLASMVGLDKSYLEKYDVDADTLAGIIPFSGHTITHFTVRKELGIKEEQPYIDKFAPFFHMRKDTPPLLMLTGDKELELLGRYEENAYFYRMMKVLGHDDIQLLELSGYGHNMVYPGIPLLLDFIRRKSSDKIN